MRRCLPFVRGDITDAPPGRLLVCLRSPVVAARGPLVACDGAQLGLPRSLLSFLCPLSGVMNVGRLGTPSLREPGQPVGDLPGAPARRLSSIGGVRRSVPWLHDAVLTPNHPLPEAQHIGRSGARTYDPAPSARIAPSPPRATTFSAITATTSSRVAGQASSL